MRYIVILFIFVLIYIYYRNISEKYDPNVSEKFEKCWDLSNLKSIVVYKTILPKVRVGNKHDGGYVIIDNLTYDYYVSCGIERDISFDDHFLKKYPNRCLKKPTTNKRIYKFLINGTTIKYIIHVYNPTNKDSTI